MKVGYIDNPDKRLFTKLTGTGENKILNKKTRQTFNVHGLYGYFLIEYLIS